ncbi:MULTISPECIES: signal recognition particle-docking protein FtsY [Pantoea]|jgi:fused signal recognition particle receptor|uniref:Signal recognition particle receptor FtsY n=1 Tax=Pantoea brenneri TaxID=472694 RepID=A0A7Y6NER1_9GAMM|nr:MULTISPECIES: signal recognition particle-docking protein FtsY [Pantoea]MBZ6395737.1 signal recognition particle-docking protein FtsY [Pantoea sp.]MBZ6439096.1 signal recognition particle-docking protein FtsY [Pantoea sp.]NUY42062.1 signal recognition particle-docking protein FtsY [Pantoea brenneri]NUY49687.1 signal recognition particle-docking protein FtsY [Pantoea brenneri]NUY59960.1 signal recognition particle-docking protein FtsY [Pantoea brenneri]
MAKEKKRGFFSWLGFGKEEEKQPSAEEQAQQAAESAQPQSEQQAATLTQAEAQAEETVAITETVAGQQRDADVTAAAPHEAAPEALAEPEPIQADPEALLETERVPEADVAPVVEADAVITPAADAELHQADAPLSDEELEALALGDAEIIETPPADAPLSDEELEALALGDAEIIETPPADAPLSDEELDALALGEAEIIETPPADAPLSDEELDALALAESEEADVVPDTVSDLPLAAAPIITQEQERPSKEGFFARLKRSLVKTRQNLGSGFISLFRGKKIDDDLFDELEEQLLIADVGVDTTRRIITHLTQQANRKQLRDAEALYGLLKAEMASILAKVDAPLDVSGKTPFVILMVGVNGVGKTTTIGKLARQYQAEGKSVMLAAGDTFRAAAVEQLQVWGQRNNIPVIAQHTGADSASVIFDAIQAAKSRGVDVLIADTAGRLQNKSHLMEELKKITRVMKKLDEDAPHEVMLTLDASTGQNAVSQARLFHEAVGLTGIALTKLDGTAKGGVIFSVADQFGIPIRYIGVGEGIEDLRPFKAEDFIEALFARED